jgi:hypothetical protein
MGLALACGGLSSWNVVASGFVYFFCWEEKTENLVVFYFLLN